eukprot:3760599-Prymnesium_polylepis.1
MLSAHDSSPPVRCPVRTAWVRSAYSLSSQAATRSPPPGSQRLPSAHASKDTKKTSAMACVRSAHPNRI